MKNRSINMLIVGFIVLAMMAVGLFVFIEYAHDVFPENITVSAEGKTTTTLPIRDLHLIPAETKEYSVNLVCEASGDYNVILEFNEEKDGGMKGFVNVTVSCDGESIFEGSLVELFEKGKTLEFIRTIEADDPTVITFSYSMPREIGNEAQGTFADFNVLLTIDKV